MTEGLLPDEGVAALAQAPIPDAAAARTSGQGAARWTEEVRLAMAWNGGVSLAVWMGGVAVELDVARRARPAQSRVETVEPPDTTTPSARTSAGLYEALCLAFDRRLVIDILAGASAGGLNGALLAGAIIYDRPLETTFLRKKWIEIGDFSSLLQPLEAEAPGSIMKGERFFEQVRLAFHELLGETPPPDDGDVRVLLDVQATDVVGEERCFYDSWDQAFLAREYRSPLQFRESRDYRPGTLAAAARASASFPGAFEPQRLYGDAARIGGFEGQTRYAIDGGLLENAPIKPALDLLPRRRTNGPTTRFLCYVNAAPTAHEDVDENPQEPTLAKVLGYTFNLPREARVVDQLIALDDAAQRAGTTADIGLRLLGLDHPHLLATAQALLPAYQRRRALRSLEELLGGTTDGTAPRRARKILDLLGEDIGAPHGGPLRLPWIPPELSVPIVAAGWNWGVRVAQRVLQLEIDLLTSALASVTDPTTADSILDARIVIERALVFLDGVHAEFAAPRGRVATAVNLLDDDSPQARADELEVLTSIASGMNVQTWESMQTATTAFMAACGSLSPELLENMGLAWVAELREQASPPDWRSFLEPALAVEVIRRTFSDDFDIESAQPLNVAQLTPTLPAPLLTLDAEHPPPGKGIESAPLSSHDKLAGLRVNHFGGFYRSSWRENDFMWGRIDGCSALARLLVDPLRAQHLRTLYVGQDRDPAAQLARALVPTGDSQWGDTDRVRLLRELVPAQTPDSAEAPAAPPDPTDLERDLRQAIEEDLYGPEASGQLTVALCARALQYEVVREEIPCLLAQLDHDRVQGARCTDLGWEIGPDSIRQDDNGGWEFNRDSIDSIQPVIDELRKASGATSLPAHLGCDDPDEATSNLGLRTLSHTFLVALSALAGVIPLTKWLQPVRLPILAVRGASALRPLDRLAVVLSFAGASWYIVARYLTIPSPSSNVFPLSLLWSATFLALVVSAAAVAGVVSVPLVRAARTRKRWRKLGEGTFFLGLLAAAGLLGFLWVIRNNSLQEALTTYHSTWAPPSTLLWIVAAAGGFQVASSLNSFLKWTGPLLRATDSHVSRLSVILGTIGAVLAGYAAVQVLAPSIDHWGVETVLALLALVAPLALAIYLDLPVLAWRSLKQAWSAIKLGWATLERAARRGR